MISRADLRTLSDDTLAEWDMLHRRLEQATAAVAALERERNDLAAVVSVLKTELAVVIHVGCALLKELAQDDHKLARYYFNRTLFDQWQAFDEVMESAAKCLK